MNLKTADETYQARRATITRYIDTLTAAIQDHSERQAADPRNWGYAGDLGSIEEHLEQMLTSLTGTED